jgi:hypothetical protein
MDGRKEGRIDRWMDGCGEGLSGRLAHFITTSSCVPILRYNQFIYSIHSQIIYIVECQQLSFYKPNNVSFIYTI